jgi:transposase
MGVPSCPGCRKRDQRIAALEQRVAELEALVRDLQARLGQHAGNSSLPPSANPPSAPKPVVKQPTGNRPGAQPGHAPQLRHRLPPERLTDTIHFQPSHCGRCHTPLPPTPHAADPQPRWHQVAELPPLAAQVIEYQAHGRTCPGCGTVTWAEIPADLRAHGIGPHLTATLTYLRAAHHVSLRGCAEIAETVFAVPIALGSLVRLEQQMSQALQTPHAEALQAVRQAAVKHVDETSWKIAGRLSWLWVAATSSLAVFLIHVRRGLQGLRALLGETIQGIVCSDRWSAYNAVDLSRRQVCWAHLKRDFQKCVDRGGAATKVGKAGLRLVREVFACWHRYRDGPGGRDALLDAMAPRTRRLERILRAGRRCADDPVATFCDNLLGLWPALWLFVVAEGVAPTNNHAERMLRRGVLWRKVCQGSRSAEGCRFVERMLTVVQSLRLQGRSVLSYLRQALCAHRQGSPVPSLLPRAYASPLL